MSAHGHDGPQRSGLVLAVVSAASFGLSGALARGLLNTGWTAGAVVLVRLGLGALVVAPFAVADLRTLLTCERDRAAEIANVMLAEAQAVPQLIRHDELDWHIHAISSEAPLDRRVIVETAMAMVDLIRADELSRLSVCADDGCEGLVLDLSRNRSRRFCSTRCSNRNAAAAYRARERSATE